MSSELAKERLMLDASKMRAARVCHIMATSGPVLCNIAQVRSIKSRGASQRKVSSPVRDVALKDHVGAEAELCVIVRKATETGIGTLDFRAQYFRYSCRIDITLHES